MDSQQLLELIRTRRSVRKYTDEPVSDEQVNAILEAGTWAPSGRNNQTWRFAIVRDSAMKQKMAGLTKYGQIVKDAAVLIPVFIHKPSIYKDMKDHQSIGSCLQNMLLMIHGLGLGGVWLGEILKKGDELRLLLELPEELELMAVVAVGHPRGEAKQTDRLSVDEVVVARC